MLEIRLHPRVVKFIKSLDEETQGRIKEKFRRLEVDPWHSRPGADIKKLSGTRGRQDLYRLRAGDFRFVYAVEEKIVWVTDAFVRGRGYRGI